jgi:hypothetical protein
MLSDFAVSCKNLLFSAELFSYDIDELDSATGALDINEELSEEELYRIATYGLDARFPEDCTLWRRQTKDLQRSNSRPAKITDGRIQEDLAKQGVHLSEAMQELAVQRLLSEFP